MDPISLTASAIAILQLTQGLAKVTRNVYKDIKNAPKEVTELLDEFANFCTVLESLTTVIEEAESDERFEVARNGLYGIPQNASRLPTIQEITKANGPLATCHGEMVVLRGKLDENASKTKRSFQWPFEKRETTALTGRLRNLKSVLDTAIATDNLKLNLTIQNGVAELKQSLLTADTRRLILDISSWLRPPNPSTNLSTAQKKRQKNTGVWFLDSPAFASWKVTPSSFLWLFGKPGSGKTILNSTIVQTLFKERDAATSIVYYYFDFQDRDKMLTEGLLNSLIVQLLTQEKIALQEAEQLYCSHYSGVIKPAVDDLKRTIQRMFEVCPNLYFIVDALDECEDRQCLLTFIEECKSWRQGNVHVLATSRRETDIEYSLGRINTSQISLEDSVVDGDVLAYVQHELQHDSKLSRWPIEVRKEIETALSGGSNGMFRWAECQLHALKGCMKLGHLRKTLRSLPETLDDTYSRMLLNIPKAYMEDARRILACLIYSYYPLSVQEVADTVAIVECGSTYYNDEERLCQSFDVLTICSGMVTVTDSLRNTEVGFSQNEYKELRLAHFSVKEYLVSKRTIAGRPSRFNLEERPTHEELANLCIRYLLHCHQQDLCQDMGSLMRYDMICWEKAAFAPYAASFWSRHLQAAQVDYSSSIVRLGLEMVTKPACLRDIMRLRRPWFGLRQVEIMEQYGCINSRESFFDGILDMTVDAVPPLFYVSLLGLDHLVTVLIDNGEDVNQTTPRGTILAAAAAGGHCSTVKLLLDKGARLNSTCLRDTLEGDMRWARTAIHEAVHRRWWQIVELLLAKGADVTISRLCPGSNPDNIRDNTALQEAQSLLLFHSDDRMLDLIKKAAADPTRVEQW